MKRKKTAVIIITLVLAAALTAAAFSLIHPVNGTGKFSTRIVDRVRFTAEPTRFTFSEKSAGKSLEFSFTLKIQKEEADFYGVIRSIEIKGLQTQSVRFQSEAGTKNNVPKDLLLPAENGKPTELVWKITVITAAGIQAPADFSVAIDYASGLSEETADEHILEIPMQLAFKG